MLASQMQDGFLKQSVKAKTSIGTANCFTQSLLPEPREGAHITKPPGRCVSSFEKFFTSMIGENLSVKPNIFKKFFWLLMFFLLRSELPGHNVPSFFY